MSEVVVDASLAVKWLVKEHDSEQAEHLARYWDHNGIRLAAPVLLMFEVANVLHRRVMSASSVLTIESANRLIETLQQKEITLHYTPNLHRRAMALAEQYSQRAAYDAHYLALAEMLDCQLWTADIRFHRAVSPFLNRIRILGEDPLL